MDAAALYDTDILEWSEQQAAALRRLAGTRGLPNDLDLERVAEEIEDLGRSEFFAVRSYLLQILAHLAKAIAYPEAEPILHWRKEVVAFHDSLSVRISPSMARRLDVAELWRRARKQAEADLQVRGQALPPDVPHACPISLPEVLDPSFDLIGAAGRIRARLAGAESVSAQ